MEEILKELRVRHLREFVDVVRGIELENDRQFQEMLNAAVCFYGLDRSDLIAELKISKAAVSRWLSGQASPHPMVRPVIADWVCRAALSQIVALQDVLPA